MHDQVNGKNLLNYSNCWPKPCWKRTEMYLLDIDVLGAAVTCLVIGWLLGYRFGKKDQESQMEMIRCQAEIQRTQAEIQSRQTSHLKHQVDFQNALEKDRNYGFRWEQQGGPDEDTQTFVFWWNDGTVVHDSKHCPYLIGAAGTETSDIVSRPMCGHCVGNRSRLKRRKIIKPSSTPTQSDSSDLGDMTVMDTSRPRAYDNEVPPPWRPPGAIGAGRRHSVGGGYAVRHAYAGGVLRSHRHSVG